MKLAAISPWRYLEQPASGDYHMILAQHVLYKPMYAKAYREAQGIKILDNGPAEHGLVFIDQLRNAAGVVDANVIVAPDNIYDAQATVQHARTFCAYEGGAIRAQYDVMMVPHGRTLDEWTWCLHELMKMRPQWIGIAKAHSRLCHTSPTSGRRYLVECVRWSYPEVKIHLLGLTENPTELYAMQGACIQGVDTSLPWKLAREGLRLGAAGVLYRRKSMSGDIIDETLSPDAVYLGQKNTAFLERMAHEVTAYAEGVSNGSCT